MNQKKCATYKNMAALQSYPIHRFEEGELVQLIEEQCLYVYHNNSWMPLQDTKKESGLSMSLYDLNKSIISSLPSLSSFDKAKETLQKFHTNQNSNYYMLLCKDISYYSIFVKDSLSLVTLEDEIIACLIELGEIVSIDLTKDNNVEIWMRVKDEVYCMYLFDCTPFIINF